MGWNPVSRLSVGHRLGGERSVQRYDLGFPAAANVTVLILLVIQARLRQDTGAPHANEVAVEPGSSNLRLEWSDGLGVVRRVQVRRPEAEYEAYQVETPPPPWPGEWWGNGFWKLVPGG